MQKDHNGLFIAGQAQVDRAMPKRVRTPAEKLGGPPDHIVIRYVHTMLADSNGLYLNLSVGKDNQVRRSWLWRFNTGERVQAKAPFGAASGKIRPRQRLMGLGSADTNTGGLSLAEARAKVLALRHAKLVGRCRPARRQARAADRGRNSQG